MKTNIALIGFMGAGKSAVGRALAAKLDMEFIDMDSLVEEKAGRSIAGIFASDGEPAFRRMEAEIAARVAGQEKKVIACGGGIVLEQNNIHIIRESSLVVYLTAEPDVLLRRVLNSRQRRPLLEVADPALAMDGLLGFRRPLYEKAADIIIDTSQLDIAGAAARISEELLKNESFNLEKHGTRQG
jgi:shikimate kinase